MDSQSLGNVLAILRLLRPSDVNTSASKIVRSWIGPGVSDVAVLKVASYAIEQAAAARQVIENSQLAAEAKQGVITTIDSVAAAFSLDKIHTPWGQHIRDVSAAIANLVILLSAQGIDTERAIPQEAADLAKDVEGLIKQFDDPELDPMVRDVAQRHLLILSTLLRHVPIFGLEGALATYFELVLKIRRADAHTTSPAQSKLDPLFKTIKTWGERLGSMDKAWNAGSRLLEHAGKAQNLLEYIPDL